MENILTKISNAVYDGEEDLVTELVSQALREGVNPEDIINMGGVVGLERLGKAFDEMEAFLPELMLGGQAMHTLLDQVKPHLSTDSENKIECTVVLGCAQGDLHDIGLNLVATQLSVSGFNVINLGTDTSVSEFIEVAMKNDAKIIGVSSLLTTAAYYQEELIKKLVKQNLRDRFRVIVGGGPITPEWTRKIGADGYSRTANQAVLLCKRLMEGEEGTIIIE